MSQSVKDVWKGNSSLAKSSTQKRGTRQPGFLNETDLPLKGPLGPLGMTSFGCYYKGNIPIPTLFITGTYVLVFYSSTAKIQPTNQQKVISYEKLNTFYPSGFSQRYMNSFLIALVAFTGAWKRQCLSPFL